MQKVRVGIIGCGVIGQHHARAAAESERVDLKAVADLRAEAAEEMGRRHGAGTIYFDAQDLLRDGEVEAVVLALPACYRTPLALRALQLGKHVLTEKPVAMNVAEVETLMQAQGDRQVACCSSRYHFLQATRKVTSFLASGALGPLRLLRCRAIKAAGPPPTAPPPPWRLSRALNGGGILANWGCYDLDYLWGICGWSLTPELVLAQAWGVPASFEDRVAPNSDAETHVAALIRCRNGVTVSYERAEFIAAQPELAWEIIGEEGSVRLQMTPQREGEHVHFRADSSVGTVCETICAADEDRAAVHAGPLNDFVRAIRHDQRPQTDLARALVIQKITDAIYRSAAEGAAVSIK